MNDKRRNQTDALTTPKSKEGLYPYNYVTCSQAQELLEQMNPDSSKYKSSLLFGVQWDLTCKFLEIRGSYAEVSGNYTKLGATNILLTTGTTERNSSMNIYDFAGNEYEWTLEYTSSTSRPCSIRGGNYVNLGSSHPAGYRTGNLTTSSYYDLSFRVALY